LTLPEKTLILTSEALKEYNLSRMSKRTKDESFITSIKYDSIYSQLAALIKTLEEMAETMSEEKL